jgi:hypothetical protein
MVCLHSKSFSRLVVSEKLPTKKMFLLIMHDFSDISIHGIFTTKKKADAAKKEIVVNSEGQFVEVTEIELDKFYGQNGLELN